MNRVNNIGATKNRLQTKLGFINFAESDNGNILSLL